MKKGVNWVPVVLYYVLACAISWPFFWMRDMNPEQWAALQLPGIVKTWSYMLGPGIAALIVLILFRKTHPRQITFFGTSAVYSLLFYCLPVLALAIPGLENQGMNKHLAPLMLGALGFISILGEELGWRGFLQDAVRPLPQLPRYLLIGFLWEIWHFTNRMRGEFPQVLIRVSVFILITSILSFIIGKATDRGKSLMVAVTLHAWIDILFEYNSQSTYTIFALAVPFWAYLLYTWKPKPTLIEEQAVISG